MNLLLVILLIVPFNTQFVVNSSFDQSLVGWDGNGTHATFSVHTLPGAAALPYANYSTAIMWQCVNSTFLPEKLNFSIWYRGSGMAVVAITYFYSDGCLWNSAGGISASGIASLEWQQYADVIAVPSGTRSVKIQLVGYNPEGYPGVIYWDDVSLIHVIFSHYLFMPVTVWWNQVS